MNRCRMVNNVMLRLDLLHAVVLFTSVVDILCLRLLYIIRIVETQFVFVKLFLLLVYYGTWIDSCLGDSKYSSRI